MTAPEARVIRDGLQRQIPAAEVVVGDLLVLAEGDIVPADAAVVDAAALLVDEAALTGESVPVDKAGSDRPGTGRRSRVGRYRRRARPGSGRGHRDRDGQRDGPDRRADGHRPGADPAAAAPGRCRPGPGRSPRSRLLRGRAVLGWSEASRSS